MPVYRVYALIHGQIIPEGHLAGCRIRPMSFEEQTRRHFSPLRAEFSDALTKEYRSYLTSLPYVDSLKLRTEYVVTHDIEEHEPLAALGGAIRAFDTLCRYLFFANIEDIYQKYNGTIGHALTYTYQVVHIYTIDREDNEREVDYQIQNRHVFLPNRPDATSWRHSTTDAFLHDALSFHDDILERALSYLYSSSIGHFMHSSPEKIALDHFKSIEVIIKSLSTKRRFADRLRDAAIVLTLTPEEEARVKRLWDDRSNGDVAHSREFGMSDRYPNQFPLPSNANYSGGLPDSIAEHICLKYYYYRKSLMLPHSKA
jgi:hypothetical protein